MTPSLQPVLFRPGVIRIIAYFVLLAAIAALAAAPDGAGDTLDVSAGIRAGTPAGLAFFLAQAVILLAALTFWFALAISPVFATRVLARSPLCVRVPISPALVAVLLFFFYVAAAYALLKFLPTDPIYGVVVVQGGFVLLIFLLSARISAAGVGPFAPVTGHPPGRFARGLIDGIGAFLLLEPLMLILQTTLLRYAQWRHLPVEEQKLIAEFRVYPAGPKLMFLLLAAAFLVPVIEEWIFRAFLFGSLRRFVRVPAAVVLSAVVFTLLHPGDRWQFAGLFVLAVFLAALYEKTQNLYAPVVLHVLINVKAVVAVLLMRAAG